MIRSDDKRRARINAIRLVLSPVPDERRDDDVVGEPDPKVVGPPAAAEPESDEYIFAIKPHELTREAH